MSVDVVLHGGGRVPIPANTPTDWNVSCECSASRQTSTPSSGPGQPWVVPGPGILGVQRFLDTHASALAGGGTHRVIVSGGREDFEHLHGLGHVIASAQQTNSALSFELHLHLDDDK
jgi:hypothetical protein